MEELLGKKSKKVILLGNNAIIRGAIESGVQFVSTFPGTPASEIGDTFSALSKLGPQDFYFEYSTNEKTAMEAATGAAFSGLKSLVAMKHFGLNVASDALLPVVYTGVGGAMVVMVADDPGCWSSAQTEQDTRYFVRMAHIPMLEPSNPQECKDFTKLAFEISDKFKIPVMIRTTTRVSHQQAIVSLSEIKESKKVAQKDIKRGQFSTMPPNVLRMKKELFSKLEKISEVSEKSTANRVDGLKKKNDSEFGIIASGVSYLYAKEILKELEIDVPVLKLGFTNPLPKLLIKNFIKNFKKILVIEEIEPFLEEQVAAIAKDANPEIKIFGSELPKIGELKPEYIKTSIIRILGIKQEFDFKKHLKDFNKIELIKRFPNLCPGCPYWLVFSGIKKAAPKNTVFGGDIGCYMLSGCPPHNIQDWLISMGSSIGISHGVKKATDKKVISIIGDSTFFHAGIPALINTVFNKSNPLIIILENSTTGMTGHQPHPGVGKTGSGEETVSLSLENMVRACGVKNLKTIDPVNQEEFINTIKEFLENKEVSVIIARRPCVLLGRR
jgi:indolepyruvate ferredoxin oxidoreductase alpha subunit